MANVLGQNTHTHTHWRDNLNVRHETSPVPWEVHMQMEILLHGPKPCIQILWFTWGPNKRILGKLSAQKLSLTAAVWNPTRTDSYFKGLSCTGFKRGLQFTNYPPIHYMLIVMISNKICGSVVNKSSSSFHSQHQKGPLVTVYQSQDMNNAWWSGWNLTQKKTNTKKTKIWSGQSLLSWHVKKTRVKRQKQLEPERTQSDMM